MLWGLLHSSANVPPATAPSDETSAPAPMGAPQASTPTHPALKCKWPMPCREGCSAVEPSLNSSGLLCLLTIPPAAFLPSPWPSPPLPLLAPPLLSAPLMPLTAPAIPTGPAPPILTPLCLVALLLNPIAVLRDPLDLLLGLNAEGGVMSQPAPQTSTITPSPLIPPESSQCPAQLPQPSAPTLGNSDASLANSNNLLANSNAFFAVIDTSPESLEPSPTVPDPIIHLRPPLPWFSDLPQSTTMTPGLPVSPADPIKISLQPTP
ncbi:hypothetical protein E4T56_gene10039 [Termitomyces sp. T112]|nr:hypothetical protein E4T56_gene10039 [Termitomyces sp. T112]